MAWITLRQFAWTERPGYVDPYPEVDGVHRVAPDRLLPVDLSYAVGVNTLAVPARYETRQHELRLMLCCLANDPDSGMRLRDEPFKASSAHIRRFVSESIGLGMLTAAVQAAYHWQDPAAHLEALPTVLAGHHNATKTRPDLLFGTPDIVLAGEARGRSEAPPTRVTIQQRDRLNSLLPWSHHHGTHPLAMTWAYATGHGVTVDLFTRSGRLPGMAGPIGQPPSPMPVQAELFDQDSLEEPRPRDSVVPPRRQASARDYDRSSPRELAIAVNRRVLDIADQLYRSAPESPIRVGGQALRGTWVDLDLLGASNGSFLLGVLEQPLSRELSVEVNARLRQHPGTQAAHMSGRLVIMIAPEAGWDLLA